MSVRKDINGMETIVKKFISAQEEEFIMKHSNNVSVKKDIFGTGLLVWFNLSVAVAKDGINKHSSVSALKALTGTVSFVSNVSMGRSGMINNTNVNAAMVLNGMVNFVL